MKNIAMCIRLKGPKLYSAKGMFMFLNLFGKMRNLITYNLALLSKLINRYNVTIATNEEI